MPAALAGGPKLRALKGVGRPAPGVPHGQAGPQGTSLRRGLPELPLSLCRGELTCYLREWTFVPAGAIHVRSAAPAPSLAPVHWPVALDSIVLVY